MELDTKRDSNGDFSGASEKKSYSRDIPDEINMNEFLYTRQEPKPKLYETSAVEISSMHIKQNANDRVGKSL
jgi:hypothetical protein